MNKQKKIFMYVGIAIAVIILALVIWYFFFRDVVEDPNKTNTPVPTGSPSSKWKPESFPLTIGMYGPKIKILQKALSIIQDGKFGNQTNSAIINAGYNVPLSVYDYNKIVPASDSVSVSQNPNLIKGVYAKYTPTIVRDLNLNQVKSASAGEWLGTITGEDNTGSYWQLDYSYYVIKSSVDIHG